MWLCSVRAERRPPMLLPPPSLPLLHFCHAENGYSHTAWAWGEIGDVVKMMFYKDIVTLSPKRILVLSLGFLWLDTMLMESGGHNPEEQDLGGGVHQCPRLASERLQQPKPFKRRQGEEGEASAKRIMTQSHRGSLTTILCCADWAFLTHLPSLHSSSWSRGMNPQVPIVLAFLANDSFLGLLRILGLGPV